jgi:putative NAD(P)H nitroreductase
MDVITAIKERRSINFFEPGETLSDAQIQELLSLSNLSPSSFNLQPWEVIVVRDPERKKILRKCALDQAKTEEASAVLIMIANPGAVEENMERMLDSWQELGYMKPEDRETYAGMVKALYGTGESLTRKIFAVKNTALYGMNIMLAAKGLGLETHPMDGFDEDSIKKEFHIPPEKIIPMLIAVGNLKSGVTLLPRAFRRNIGEFVKYEDYS